MTTEIRLILVPFVIVLSSTVINSNQVSSMIHLDDGTQVVLNTGSILIYPDNPSAYNFRYVRLVGQGVFVVAQSDLWFVLHLDNMLIKTKQGSFVITTTEIGGRQVQHVQIKSGKVEIDYGNPDHPPLANT
jgi:hypothetical protein